MTPDYIYEQLNEFVDSAAPKTLNNSIDSIDENHLNSIRTEDQNTNDLLASTMKKPQTFSGSIEVNSHGKIGGASGGSDLQHPKSRNSKSVARTTVGNLLNVTSDRRRLNKHLLTQQLQHL